MAKGLTARAIEAARHPGKTRRPITLSAGNGLYLQIARGGTKSWLFKYRFNGKSHEMGLGPYGPAPLGRSLADAREAALNARALMGRGVDPIGHRDSSRRIDAEKLEKDQLNTFQSVANLLLASKEAGWKNAKHKQQWHNTLATYVYPFIGDFPVSEISIDHVLRVLRPIWNDKPETASRIRGRIEKVLALAKTLKLREGENPAIWRDNLEHVLPKPRSIQGRLPENYPALPWEQMPTFFLELRAKTGVDAVALQVCILTAARSGEVLEMRWREVNLDRKLWTVPAERMKATREHRQPLSPEVMTLLQALKPLSTGPNSFVFPGRKPGKCLSQMAMLMLLRRMNPQQDDGSYRWIDRKSGRPVTVHGMRSSFRDWAGEATSFPTDVVEMHLAHKIRNKTEAAYARGDLLEKRSKLVGDWASFCLGKGHN